jgi:hypothetical protein
MKDFSFQGKVYLGTRLPSGLPGPLKWVGDAPLCEVSLKAASDVRTESYSGQRLTTAKLIKSNEASIKLQLNHATADNLALGLYGSKNTVAPGTVTNETLPAVVVGDIVVLAKGGVSSLVITDSAGTPATLVAGTDYALDSAPGGVVSIKSLGAYTQPFKAAYSNSGSTDVAMFTVPAPERYLYLDGINTIDNSRVIVRLYRTKFDPASTLALINASFGQIDLTGEVLYDELSAADALLGGFGKIEQLT